MNFSNLPLLYLKHLFEYLNSFDQINLLVSIDYSSEVKEYLFNYKVLNLTNCFKLKAAEFKKLSRFYKDINQIEELNLNFCYNLSWKSLTTQMPKLNFQLLTKLNLLSIKIDLINIMAIVSSSKNLKELSFSLNEAVHTSDLKCFSSLQIIRLELNVQLDEHVIELLNNFKNVYRLEIFSSKQINQTKFIFSFSKFKNKFEHLTDLVVLKCTNILFNLSELNEVLSRLNNYSITFASNIHNWNKYVDLNKIKNLTIVIHQVIRPNFDVDYLFEEITFDSNNQLEELEISKIYNKECIITVLPFRMENLTYLNRLDLKYIHIHSTDSICELLSKLINLKHLFLPCCALACNQFKESDTRYLFKRIINSEDEDTEPKHKIKEPECKQLEYLVSLSLISFGLYSPKLHDKVKDRQFYNCRNVDNAELEFVAKFCELKLLYFEGFKFIGTAQKFEHFLSSLSSQLHLTLLSVVNINNFTMFDYQTKLITQLVNFKYLKQLCIDQANFYLSKKLIDNVSCLTDLKYLKLSTKTEDKNLVKNQIFDSLSKLDNLTLFDVRCSLSKSDLILLKKQLKKVLPNTIFISVSKIDTTPARDATLVDDKSYLKLITLSNTSIKYEHDVDILNFLNEFD